jgi:hypothetical protein
MSDHSFSRRDFIVGGLSGSAAASLAPALADDAPGTTANTAAGTAAASGAAAPVSLTNPAPGAWARWLDGRAPTIDTGATWGMP